MKKNRAQSPKGPKHGFQKINHQAVINLFAENFFFN